MPASAALSPAPRAPREFGRETRSRLLDAAAELFWERGFGATSLVAVAAAAGALSQVTYYFGSKEALFVEAACREMLHLGARAEAAAAAAATPRAYAEALVATVAPAPALGLMVEALALGRRRADLAAQLSETFDRLHAEGARAYAGVRRARGWTDAADARAEAERFWALALGVGLRTGGSGRAPVEAAAEMSRALGMAPLPAEAA